MRNCRRRPPLSRVPVSDPPPPVLTLQIPETAETPRTSVTLISPVPRLSWYRPVHTLDTGPVASARRGSGVGDGTADAGGELSPGATAFGSAPARETHVTFDGLLIS